MYAGLNITAVIPAFNEAEAIADVVADLLAERDQIGSAVIDDIIVADNGSTDNTAALAKQAGARVVYEARRGYGTACLAALAAVDAPDVILFVDGDRSVRADQVLDLLTAIASGADLAIGSRTLGNVEAGAMTWPQQIGNRLVAALVGMLWQTTVTDFGPFRAIRLTGLNHLAMQDAAYGWTVEMQVKAIQHGLAVKEVPVDCLVRIGRSKVSGTVRGVIGAASGMLGTVFKLWWQERRAGHRPWRSGIRSKPR